MPFYHAIGNALVSPEEIKEKAISLGRFENEKKKQVDFLHGVLSRDVPTPQPVARSGARIPFQPIGLGKPLTVQLRHVFRGKHPERGAQKPMLVTSAIKAINQNKANARAINFLIGTLGDKKGFSHVPATSQGTPIIYNSPALIDFSMSLTVEVGFNDFRGNEVKRLGDLLQSAGAMPVFVAHSAYLIGAGLITKLAAKVGERIFEKGPVLTETAGIDMITGGAEASRAGFKILASDDFPDDFLKEHQVNSAGQVVNAENKVYDGDLPYVTFSLDGTKRDDLKEFQATQASAEMLANYFAIRDGQQVSLGLAREALQLYNDLDFRRKADNLMKKMDELGSGAEYDKLKVQYDACVKNIQEKALHPR